VDDVVRVYTDRSAFLAVMGTVLEVEHDLAAEIGRRTGLSSDDPLVRVTANACVGAFRAAMRASVAEGDAARIPQLTGEGLDRLSGLFDALPSE
jgi:hypothetical protein